MKVTSGMVDGIAGSVLMANYDNPQLVPTLHRHMWDLCCSDWPKVAIAAPRGCAKSTSITFSYLIAVLGYRERRFAVIISDTEGQAIEFLADLRMAFGENKELRKVFGVHRILKDSQTDMVVEFADGEQFRVLAKGSLQKLRGLKWRGQRPDIFIGDDLENEELTENDDRREKFRTWFYGSVLPAGNDRCIYRIVGTVLHFDALLERLMPKSEDPNTYRNILSEWNYSKEWKSVKYRAHPSLNDFSKLLWEEKLSEERLRAYMADYRDQGLPDVYSREYLNEPISDDNAYFAKPDFLPITPKDRELRKTFYAGADLAISKADRAAYTVIYVAGLDEEGKLQVIHRAKGRWDGLEIINEMFVIQERHSPELFFIEDENIRKAIGAVLEMEMHKRQMYINFERSTPSKDKETRNRALQSRMRAGGVLFDHKTEWFPDCERELRRFPKGPYKDDADALGLIAAGLDKLVDPPTDAEVLDEEWEEEFGFDLHGMNPVTGY